MKRISFKKIAALSALAVCMGILAGCGGKQGGQTGSGDITNVSEAFRNIMVSGYNGNVGVTRAAGDSLSAYSGLSLFGGDSVSVAAVSDLTLEVDSDKHLYAEEDTNFWLESAGAEGNTKTTIHLEEGAVLCRLENKLAADETFQVETPASTMSVRGTVFRVKIIRLKDGEVYNLVEVFDGTVATAINEDGETVTLQEGECALVKSETDGSEAVFVLNDEIDQEFWTSGETGDFTVAFGGNGSPILTIPYEKLPKNTIQKLIDYEDDGHELVVDTETLETVKDTGHNYIAETVRESTCTERGMERLRCTLCGDFEERELPLASHTVTVDRAVAATCTESGLTEGSHCSVCGEVFTAQTAIPAAGHTITTDGAVAATCTVAGKTAGTHCTVCGTVLTAQQAIPAVGHTVVADAAVSATCTVSGLTAGSHCSVCQEVLTAQEVIPASGHTVVTDVAAVAPTCIATGMTAKTHCSVCNTVLSTQQTVPAKGHTVVTDTAAIEPTCTEAGMTASTHCSVCNEVLTRPAEVPAKGHTEETDAAVAATCTVAGKTAGSHCTVCKEVLTAQEEIPAKGHVEEPDEAVEPTCTESGLTAGSHCTVCKEVLTAQEEIPAKGHVEEPDEAVEPTCTESGLTAGNHCTVCKEVLTAQEEVPAKGHTPGDPEEADSSTNDGCYDEVIRCAECDEILSQKTIPHAPSDASEADSDDPDACYDSVVFCSHCEMELSRTTVAHAMEDTGRTEKPKEMTDTLCYYQIEECAKCKKEQYTEKPHTKADTASGWVEGSDNNGMITHIYDCTNDDCGYQIEVSEQHDYQENIDLRQYYDPNPDGSLNRVCYSATLMCSICSDETMDEVLHAVTPETTKKVTPDESVTGYHDYCYISEEYCKYCNKLMSSSEVQHQYSDTATVTFAEDPTIEACYIEVPQCAECGDKQITPNTQKQFHTGHIISTLMDFENYLGAFEEQTLEYNSDGTEAQLMLNLYADKRHCDQCSFRWDNIDSTIYIYVRGYANAKAQTPDELNIHYEVYGYGEGENTVIEPDQWARITEAMEIRFRQVLLPAY